MTGADVDREGRIGLHHAAMEDDAELIDRLVEDGADVDHQGGHPDDAHDEGRHEDDDDTLLVAARTEPHPPHRMTPVARSVHVPVPNRGMV